MNIRLPFVILNRVTYDKLITNLKDTKNLAASLSDTADKHAKKAIVLEEENRNLHYNYEQLLAQHKELTHQFNKVKHSYYNLKKKASKS